MAKAVQGYAKKAVAGFLGLLKAPSGALVKSRFLFFSLSLAAAGSAWATG